MKSLDEKIIKLSKNKISLLILVSIIFVLLGIWLIELDHESIRSLHRSPALTHAMGYASILFFGFIGIFGCFKIFDKKPGLVLNGSGIIDNSSGVAAGFIPWSDILKADIFEIKKQKLLVIKLKNPNQYIERGSKFKQALNKINHKMCGSPVVITSSALQIKFAELLPLFNEYQNKYGKV